MEVRENSRDVEGNEHIGDNNDQEADDGVDGGDEALEGFQNATNEHAVCKRLSI